MPWSCMYYVCTLRYTTYCMNVVRRWFHKIQWIALPQCSGASVVFLFLFLFSLSIHLCMYTSSSQRVFIHFAFYCYLYFFVFFKWKNAFFKSFFLDFFGDFFSQKKIEILQTRVRKRSFSFHYTFFYTNLILIPYRLGSGNVFDGFFFVWKRPAHSGRAPFLAHSSALWKTAFRASCCAAIFLLYTKVQKLYFAEENFTAHPAALTQEEATLHRKLEDMALETNYVRRLMLIYCNVWFPAEPMPNMFRSFIIIFEYFFRKEFLNFINFAQNVLIPASDFINLFKSILNFVRLADSVPQQVDGAVRAGTDAHRQGKDGGGLGPFHYQPPHRHARL